MPRTYGRLWLAKDGWHLALEPHLMLRAKRMFARISRGHVGTLVLPHTPEMCRDLQWFGDRYPLAVTHPAELEAGARTHRDTIARLEELIDPDYVPPTFELALPARSYQAREAALYLAQGFLLIADEVGLGKTASAICSFTDPRTLPAVVVTLTALPAQWEQQIRLFAPRLTTHIVKRGTPYALPTFFGRGPDVVIVNYAKLSGWAQVLAAYAKSACFDEVQELRHAAKGSGSELTQKYAAAAHLAGAVPFRIALSATPIYNFGGEIYNVLNVLKPDVLGSKVEFEREWCTFRAGKSALRDPKAFGSWAREQCLIIRHRRADVGRELPDVIRVTHTIEADAKRLEEVDGTATELARIILGQTGATLERGAAFQASEQLSMVLRQATGIAKAPYVADFVRMLVESGESVVLCGWHRACYDVWRERLQDLGVAMFTGSESVTEKESAKQAFIHGGVKVLLLSLRAGAGMDGLQKGGRVIVFGELDWSPGVMEQCVGRLHRDGQPDPVVAYFLVSETGSDPVVAETLGLKREQVEGIRDPDQDLAHTLESGGDRVRRLAEFYLERRGVTRRGRLAAAEPLLEEAR